MLWDAHAVWPIHGHTTDAHGGADGGHSLGILLTTQYYVLFKVVQNFIVTLSNHSHLSVCGVPASFPASTHDRVEPTEK